MAIEVRLEVASPNLLFNRIRPRACPFETVGEIRFRSRT